MAFTQNYLQAPESESTLQNYRGTLKHPANFFHSMKANVFNHGFEYLMIDYLRSRDGSEARDKLVLSLLNQYKIQDFEYKYLNIFKLGDDSTLHDEISKYEDPDVKVLAPMKDQDFFRRKPWLVGHTRPVSNIAETFRYSDLLIMVSDGRNHTYGFIGEVEGHHGENLFRGTYWSNKDGIKGRYTTFALGASDRKKKIDGFVVKENIILTQDSDERWILHFSNANAFMKSFKSAINNLELCLGGHFSNIGSLDESHQKILNIIEDEWNGNVYDLIKKLESLVDYDVDINEYSYQMDENSEIIYKPSPIALNSFYLHRLTTQEKA